MGYDHPLRTDEEMTRLRYCDEKLKEPVCPRTGKVHHCTKANPLRPTARAQHPRDLLTGDWVHTCRCEHSWRTSRAETPGSRSW